jgi:hypothetical protein
MKKGFGMIRHATIDDTPRLLPLLSELGYPATLEDLNIRFLKFLSNPGYGVAVCEMNEEITGFVALDNNRSFDFRCNPFFPLLGSLYQQITETWV